MFRYLQEKFPNDIFKNEDIFVFWNVEDYPIPANEDNDQTRKSSHNIISALRQLGSVGSIFLLAMDKDSVSNGIVTKNAGFLTDAPTGYRPGERTVLETMIAYIVGFIRIEPPEDDQKRPTFFYPQPQEPPICVVIAKEKPGSELYRTLAALKERGIKIVLLNPPGDEYVFPSVDSVLKHGKTFAGESLMTLSKYPSGFGELDCDYRDAPMVRSSYSLNNFMEPHIIKWWIEKERME